MNLSVDKVLSRAGYRPSTAASAESLDEILKQRGADVVLVDIADAQTVERHAPPGSSGPIVLPVLDHATRQEMAKARKTWGVALKSPASSDSLLDAVDEAAELRSKADRTPV